MVYDNYTLLLKKAVGTRRNFLSLRIKENMNGEQVGSQATR